MNIANELKQVGIIKLPNLYTNPDLMNQLYELLYVEEGYNATTYSFLLAKRRSLKEVYKNRQNFYFFLTDFYDRDSKKLEGNSYVCVSYLNKKEIKRQVVAHEEDFMEYKISLETLKRILFKISITGATLSHYINEEFLRGNIKQVKVHPYNKYRR